jgi:metal-responsive CopG/Arc/MetJ family transcriptional regulator
MKNVKKEYRLGSSNFSVSIPVELLLELNKLANKSGVSRNRLINHSKERANLTKAKSVRQLTNVAFL